MSKTHTVNKLEAAQTNALAQVLIDASQAAQKAKLSNLTAYLDELANIAPRNEYFASNAVCTSIGYTLCNQLLWDFRKKQTALNTPAPTVDIFNDGYGEMYEQRATRNQMIDNGMDDLPIFNALALKGTYKSMLRMQLGNTAYAAEFPVRMPHEILHEMLTQENDELIAKAYAAQSASEIASSKAATLIKAEMMKQASSQKERNAPKNKVETDFVMNELQKAIPEPFSDEIWNELPLWVQYKLTTSVFKQIVKAIATESRKHPEGSHTRDQLLEMIDAMQLELECAYRTAEIRLAFNMERLNERHEVIVKQTETAAA